MSVNFDSYVLAYGNMVDPENAAQIVELESGSEEIRRADDPLEYRFHGENPIPTELEGHIRIANHELEDRMVRESSLFSDSTTVEELFGREYDNVENDGGFNLEERSDSKVHVVLLPMTDSEIDLYEKAELGYEVEQVDSQNINPKTGSDLTDADIFAAFSDNKGEVDPIYGYVFSCLDAYDRIGLRQEFLSNTVTHRDSPIEDWLKEH